MKGGSNGGDKTYGKVKVAGLNGDVRELRKKNVYSN